ncbi:MAG TPA: L,D-transpeptidase family protein [Bdellovibrionales bacterium]|nr:L,D-transpeptidase family protein [Bdellovibrionales bacterium]
MRQLSIILVFAFANNAFAGWHYPPPLDIPGDGQSTVVGWQYPGPGEGEAPILPSTPQPQWQPPLVPPMMIDFKLNSNPTEYLGQGLPPPIPAGWQYPGPIEGPLEGPQPKETEEQKTELTASMEVNPAELPDANVEFQRLKNLRDATSGNAIQDGSSVMDNMVPEEIESLIDEEGLESDDAGTEQEPAFDPAGQVVAYVSIAKQQMVLTVGGQVTMSAKVSTARKGYKDAVGCFKPATRIHKMWYSRKYKGAPMPYSVFYYGGYAVHGTNEVSKLGTPASHGCVRLDPADAKAFYTAVLNNGLANTTVCVE